MEFAFLVTTVVNLAIMIILATWAIIITAFLFKYKRTTPTVFSSDISVIIPAYNEEKHIQACINSIKETWANSGLKEEQNVYRS